MTIPSVLNKYKNVGVDKLDGVYIGRGSPWGNPFPAGLEGDRAMVIEKHRLWLMQRPIMIASIKQSLRNQNLICFCSPCECHGDLLLDIANDNEVSGFEVGDAIVVLFKPEIDAEPVTVSSIVVSVNEYSDYVLADLDEVWFYRASHYSVNKTMRADGVQLFSIERALTLPTS